MGSWNNKVRLSRFERNGIIVLALLILGLTFFKTPIISWFVKDKKPVAANTAYAGLIQQIEEAKPDYSDYEAKQTGTDKPGNVETSSGYYKTEKPDIKNFIIEINAASAEEFEKLYGIGKVFAARIIKFREGLGGFQRIDQINDVYGIEDSTYEKIRPHLKIIPAPVRKININEANLETLSKNPYVAPTLAKQFIGYRTKVKPFDNVEEVKKLYYIKDHPELFEKLSPYITVN